MTSYSAGRTLVSTTGDLLLKPASFVQTTILHLTERKSYSSVVSPPWAQQIGKSWEEIPGPRSLPMLGTLYKYFPGGEYYAKDRMKADWKKFQKYGNIVKEEIFPGEVFIHLFHPDDIEQVYRHEGKYPYRGELRATAKYAEDHGLPPDLANSKEKQWATIRSPVAKELLQVKAVQNFLRPQDEAAQDLVRVIKANRDSDNQLHIIPELSKFAIEALCTVLFNRRLGMMKPTLDAEMEKLFNAANGMFEAMYKCIFFWPLHKNGKSKLWKKFEKDMDYLMSLSTKYTHECLHQRENETNIMKRLQDRGMDDNVAIGIAQALFGGAIDTTSNSTYFLLYNLAKNPEKQALLYNSITEAMPDRQSPVTVDIVNQMAYLKACMKESFRLTPISGGSLRILDKDIVVRSYRIPAGHNIQLHTAVASQRSDVFEKPEDFYPERWLRGHSKKCHPFATLPFSHGPRNCVGKRLAEQEILLATIRILQHFKIEHDGSPLEVETTMISNPLQDRLKLIDRK